MNKQEINQEQVEAMAEALEAANEVEAQGELSTVRKARIDRQLKHYVKRFGTKKLSAKDLTKAEKVNRGMTKIYALIDRGLKNVTT